jgi:hypothetical protein
LEFKDQTSGIPSGRTMSNNRMVAAKSGSRRASAMMWVLLAETAAGRGSQASLWHSAMAAE